MKKIKINKEKSIGSVIYIVEGEKTEPAILKHIFSKIFGYSVVSAIKNNYFSLESDKNKYSRVYIVVAEYPQINKLEESKDFFDNIYLNLTSNYNLDLENSAIFYIFDRDRKCNRPTNIKNNLKKYHNSRDNGNEMNGLFLLSYPSIEAFLCNLNQDEKCLSNGIEAKEYTSKFKIENISLNSLNISSEEFLKIYEKICLKEFQIDLLDNFQEDNIKIFNYEEKMFNKKNTYKTLSLLILSLIDLGIIELEN